MQTYTIRESNRAKKVRLKVTVESGLEVVIPRGYDQAAIPALLESEMNWLEKARKWVEEQRRLISAKPPDLLPTEMHLKAIGEIWQVEYRRTSTSRTVARDNDSGRLRVSGDIDNKSACKKALRRWTARKAQRHLVPALRQLSHDLEMPFSGTTVRNQRSRWGSCSPQKNISINQKLLFVPEDLVRYVFIHELCHLVHLNHSSRFWALVRKKEPSSKQLDRQLGAAWSHVPPWMEGPR